MPTERQIRAVKAIVENGGIVSKAMESVGYTKATAKTPQKLTTSIGFKEASKDIVKQFEKERQRAIDKLTKTINKAKYRDLTDAIDKFTKNIQLLSGEDTERQGIEISIVNAEKYDL